MIRRTLRISWTVNKSNETVIQEADTTRSLRIHKLQAIYSGHVIRRKKLEVENLMTNGMIEEKRSTRKMLNLITKLLNVGRVADAIKAARDRDA